MTKVLVLGGTGMLGRALVRVLTTSSVDYVQANRYGIGLNSIRFNASENSIDELIESIPNVTHIVNAIGVIKHRIDETKVESRLAAIDINSAFPHRLALVAESRGIRVVEIATDCVYSGATGGYSETSMHDAEDLYGKSKSIGEAPSQAVMRLRCSIIGPEDGMNLSLLEWVRSRPHNADIRGYDNHFWNGVTTQAFAEIVVGTIEYDYFKPGTWHLVPKDTVSKAELVRLLAARLFRHDLNIQSTCEMPPTNRTLSTNFPEGNSTLWAIGGYTSVPEIAKLIEDMDAELQL